MWNFWATDTRWSEIADFKPIIACSASALTPSDKSSINTNRESITRFPMSLRWSSYVAPKSPKGGRKRKTLSPSLHEFGPRPEPVWPLEGIKGFCSIVIFSVKAAYIATVLSAWGAHLGSLYSAPSMGKLCLQIWGSGSHRSTVFELRWSIEHLGVLRPRNFL